MPGVLCARECRVSEVFFYSDKVRSRGKTEDDSLKGDAGGGGGGGEEEEEQIVAEEGSGAQGRTKKGSSVVV